MEYGGAVSTDCQIVLSTCPDEQTAERLAAALVEKDIAACVNIIPGIQSVYHWKGKVEKDREWLLVIKAAADRYDTVEKTIVSLHPYELPEIIAVPISAGLPAYLAWIVQPR
jgi:periplasmic divalent cation tolerance protein